MQIETLVRGVFFDKATGQALISGTWVVQNKHTIQERRYVFVTDDERQFPAGLVEESAGFRTQIQLVALNLARDCDCSELWFRPI
ncbi:hypothetical protein [Gloeobacter violaceus]|uniref:Gsl3197 protein n=1 Tax=Gloeobacter violaceus (strain ATCC 29082 / PCC 7421) TaxID=251221 RepID=Q7NGH2_GLOVI|nr:hypothetical protein [Gloeobacter violaceus]BAC91138.1 gsl3197 [Gloeobacter violaceus PCC 7421]